jgi:hypothetical protein
MIENPRVVKVSDGRYGSLTPTVAILAVLSFAGLGFGCYDFSQLKLSRQAGVQLRTAERQNAHEVATLDQKQSQADIINARLQVDVEVVTKRLRITQRQLKEARAEAAQVLDQDEQTLAQTVRDFKNKLTTKASTDELTTTISTINANINSAKADLEGTSKEVNVARAELHVIMTRSKCCGGGARAITSNSWLRGAIGPESATSWSSCARST